MRGIVLLAAAALPACGAQAVRTPVEYVDPHIGGIAHLLGSTSPAVQVPHGMMRLAPVTGPRVTDRYLATKIYGFPAGGLTMMPTLGDAGLTAASQASEYDHDKETATPYYFSTVLEDYGIKVEFTALSRAAYYRISYPGGRPAHLVLRSPRMEVEGESAVRASGGGRGGNSFSYVEFNRPFDSHTSTDSAVTFNGPSRPWVLEVRAGLSFIDTEQARRNLAEDIPGWDFAAAKANARRLWSEALGKVEIQGGTEEQRTLFYTCLYRSLQYMTDIAESGGRYYSGFDNRIHDSDGHDFYVDDGLWDSYRTRHPLQLIIEPERHIDQVRSYLRMYDQSGWLPVFPFLNGDRPIMLGNHVAPFILDTYVKGLRGFDVEKAYAGMRKNAFEASMLPDHRGPTTELEKVYFDKGFFPALGKGEPETVKDVNSNMRRQAVAVTLETAYDDWAISEMAAALGKKDDARLFARRGQNYRNVFDPKIGFMAPRRADGSWVENYDPKRSGGQAGRDYFAECNGWVYTFHVQHDPAGLIELIGGREKFVNRLDALFAEPYDGYKYAFLAQFPDSTGLIGQYAQGNEPSFHIPYLYNYAGAPWKAQKRLREIMKVWFAARPLGLPGDDDSGTMSAWYVFSAMGFYPMCPGKPVYDIGSPLFRETRIQLPSGKVFTIVARDVSAANKYIQSAELNGKPLNRPWFSHADLAAGGTLVLQMGPDANKDWGASR